MRLGKLLCQLILGVVLSFVGFVLFKLYSFGEFNKIESFGLNNCDAIATPNDLSCEDIQSLSDNSLLLSCGNLLSVFQLFEPSYIPYYNYRDMQQRISSLPASKKGEIYLLSKDSKYKKPLKMALSGYVHPDFHPHGMSVIRHGNNDFVFIVNHRRDGEFVSVFKVDLANKKLKYWTSITSNSFLYINNLAVVAESNGNFYFTNWMKNDPGSWNGIFEVIVKDEMKLSNVGFCETPTDFLSKRPGKNVIVSCKIVADKLGDANGISLSNDGSTLYVVNGNHLFQYAVHVQAENDNEITLLKQIEMKNAGCDNVNASPTDDNKVYVACFPKFVTKMAASMMSVDIGDNNEKKGAEALVIDVDNSKILGSTAVFKVDKYGIIVSIFDSQRYLVCDL